MKLSKGESSASRFCCFYPEVPLVLIKKETVLNQTISAYDTEENNSTALKDPQPETTDRGLATY
jgi:hypothetical protein